MSFDPENVERYNFNPGMGAHSYPGGVIVKAADYDQLLALWRQAEMVRMSDLERIQKSYYSGSQTCAPASREDRQ